MFGESADDTLKEPKLPVVEPWSSKVMLAKEKEVDARYAGLGKSFNDYYKR